MPRIPYPDLEKASSEVREMLGRLPAPANIFNMMAHAQTCVKPMMKLGGTLLGKLELDSKLRELCLLHAVKLDERHFGSLPLGSVELLAVCHPAMPLGPNRAIEVADLAGFPLLLLDGGFGFRRAFDAASRMAGLKPTILFESRNPHTLLALAEAGHGVAIIPSQLQCRRYDLRVVGLTHRRRVLQEPLTISWDKRRSLPRFAADYCTMLAAYMRETFPITRPTEPVSKGRKRSHRSRTSGT